MSIYIYIYGRCEGGYIHVSFKNTSYKILFRVITWIPPELIFGIAPKSLHDHKVVRVRKYDRWSLVTSSRFNSWCIVVVRELWYIPPSIGHRGVGHI